MLIPSRQVYLGRVIPSVPIPSSNGKMTTSVPIGSPPRRGFNRYLEVGRADWGRFRSEGQKRGAERGGLVAAQIAQLR
jgi:hypothetical protein